MAELHRVRTGPTSTIEFNDADLKAWRAAGNKEYGAKPASPAEPKAEPEAETSGDAIAARAVDVKAAKPAKKGDG